MGFALLTQAGVGIGMALFASQRFPELKDIMTCDTGSDGVARWRCDYSLGTAAAG